MQHTRGLCLGPFLGPPCKLWVGPAHLYNLYTILPLDVFWPWHSVANCLVLRLVLPSFSSCIPTILSNSALDYFQCPHILVWRYLRAWRPRFLLMVPIRCRIWFLLDGLLLVQREIGLLQFRLSCHWAFPAHTDGTLMEWGDVCVTMVVLTVCDMWLLFLPHKSGLRRLWDLPSTTAVYSQSCTHLSLWTLLPPLGILRSCFLVFLLLIKYWVVWDSLKQ